MFIDHGSLVTVKQTAAREDLRGRFGRVARIRIVAHTGDVMVFVELFDPQTGASPVMLFEPHELERRKNIAIQSRRPIASEELHAIRFMELQAA